MSDLTILLPEHGDGSRRNRRRQPTRRRRPSLRRPSRRILLAVLGGVVAVALGFGILSTLTGDDGGGDAGNPAPATSSGTRRSTLLLHHDAAGSLVGATLVVVSSTGGGVVLHLPPGTMLETPSLGLAPLREAAQQSDELGLVAVENLLGTTVDWVQRVDPAVWAAAVAPAGAVTVDVPTAVRRSQPGGSRVAFPAGAARIGPDAVSDLLGLPASTDLQRIVRVQAFWDAWLAAVRSRTGVAPDPGLLGIDIQALAKGTVSHVVLPVDPLGGGDELYKVDPARLDAQVRRALPAAPPRARRVSVQVLNGTGKPGAIAAALPALVAAGARMAVSGNADRFGYAQTQIAYYDDADAAAAQRLQQALGFGEVVRSRVRIDAVTLTVVVGADFRASSGGTSTVNQGASP